MQQVRISVYTTKHIMLFYFFSCQPSNVTPDLVLLKELEENPERAVQICPKLSAKHAQERCQKLSMRPHLWSNPESMERAQSQRKIGPSSKHLIPSIVIQAPTYKESSECTETECWEQKALATDDFEDILIACGGIKKERWRKDCAFVVAEAHLSTKGYAHSAHLCLYSGDFAANCFMHLSYRLAETIPPAISEEQEEWDEIIFKTQTIHQFWKDKDPYFGESMVQQLWAKALDVSYTKAGIVILLV